MLMDRTLERQVEACRHCGEAKADRQRVLDAIGARRETAGLIEQIDVWAEQSIDETAATELLEGDVAVLVAIRVPVTVRVRIRVTVRVTVAAV